MVPAPTLDALIAGISSIACPLGTGICNVAVFNEIVRAETSASGAHGRVRDQESSRSLQPALFGRRVMAVTRPGPGGVICGPHKLFIYKERSLASDNEKWRNSGPTTAATKKGILPDHLHTSDTNSMYIFCLQYKS